MPAQPFASIPTDKLDEAAGRLRSALIIADEPEFWAGPVGRKFVEIRRELDRRHTARLAALAARTGIRCGSILFAEAHQP